MNSSCGTCGDVVEVHAGRRAGTEKLTSQSAGVAPPNVFVRPASSIARGLAVGSIPWLRARAWAEVVPLCRPLRGWSTARSDPDGLPRELGCDRVVVGVLLP
jgi:hypothetical protein